MALNTDPAAQRHLNAVRTGPRGRAPVVLIHPAGLDLTYWDNQIAGLGSDHDVVAFDLPGHGRSPGGPEDWSIGRMTRAVCEFSATVGADGVHLVGSSLGGILAQAVAVDHPALLQSLTLIGTAATFPDAARSAMRHRAATVLAGGMQALDLRSLMGPWFSDDLVERRPDIIDRATKTLLADDPSVQAAMWNMIAGTDLLAGLHRISCPTMVLVGDNDVATPFSAAQVLQDNIANCHLHVVPGAAHLPALENPRDINRHLLDFLTTAA